MLYLFMWYESLCSVYKFCKSEFCLDHCKLYNIQLPNIIQRNSGKKHELASSKIKFTICFGIASAELYKKCILYKCDFIMV